MNLVQWGEACKILGVSRSNGLHSKHKINALKADVELQPVFKNRKDHIRPLPAYFLRKFLPSTCDTDINALRRPGNLRASLF